MQLIQIYNGKELERSERSINGFIILDNYTLYAYENGCADDTAVKSGGNLIVEGGTVTNSTVRNNGVMTVNSGVANGIAVWSGGKLALNGGASEIDMSSGSSMTVNAGGSANAVSIKINAQVIVGKGGFLEESHQHGGSIRLDGGLAQDIQMYSGVLTVGKEAIAEDVTQIQHGTVINVRGGGNIVHTTSIGGDIALESGATAINSILTGYLKMETGEKFCSSMTLAEGSVHQGTLSIAEGYGLLTAAKGAVIDFTVADVHPDNSVLIDNIAGIAGSPSFSLTVKTNQAPGAYFLADNVSSFEHTVSVYDTTANHLGTLSLQQPLKTDGAIYTLSLADRRLSLDIAVKSTLPYDLEGNADGVSWKGSSREFHVQYSQDGFEHALSLDADGHSIDTYALPTGEYQWRVRNADDENWANGETIIADGPKGTAPNSWKSTHNGSKDLFFGNVNGTWSSSYQARHVGCMGTWESGTDEIVELEGMNRILDTFTGSNDASVLVLTDDPNGDALFLDDIYSAFPEGQQARLSRLDEIRTGAGNDLVDMTSQRFVYQGNGVLIRGGDGNDTIWAGCGNTVLLGDAGDDRLVGSPSKDVLSGGAGNDSLQGGGGEDIFCFCAEWGEDIIEQLPGEGNSVILWFCQSKSELNLTFEMHGNDTVITAATGSAIIAQGLELCEGNCRFGGDEHLMTATEKEDFSRLSSIGAFDAFSSTYIFAEA